MNNKTEYLINSIFEKLKSNKSRKIHLKENELKNFIFFLLKDN